MGEREDRMAKNEALHREVNERVHEIDASLRGAGDLLSPELVEFFCECSRSECMEKLRVSRAEYESVRASPVRFLLIADHFAPEVESIVQQNERFAVVEKHVKEQAIARSTDPRS